VVKKKGAKPGSLRGSEPAVLWDKIEIETARLLALKVSCDGAGAGRRIEANTSWTYGVCLWCLVMLHDQLISVSAEFFTQAEQNCGTLLEQSSSTSKTSKGRYATGPGDNQ
jgi:hypothetical protein